MDVKKLGITVLTVILAMNILATVSAVVVVPATGRALVYENGSFVILGQGTYDSIQRVDNIWYVNGVPVTDGLVNVTYATPAIDYTGIIVLALFILIGLYFSAKPIGTLNLILGILVLGVSAGLLLGGYLSGLWFFAFAGVAVGLICLLRGTDLL